MSSYGAVPVPVPAPPPPAPPPSSLPTMLEHTCHRSQGPGVSVGWSAAASPRLRTPSSPRGLPDTSTIVSVALVASIRPRERGEGPTGDGKGRHRHLQLLSHGRSKQLPTGQNGFADKYGLTDAPTLYIDPHSHTRGEG